MRESLFFDCDLKFGDLTGIHSFTGHPRDVKNHLKSIQLCIIDKRVECAKLLANYRHNERDPFHNNQSLLFPQPPQATVERIELILNAASTALIVPQP